MFWNVLGGTLLSGQHTESVTVIWTEGNGALEVTEVTAAGCEGETFTLEVEATTNGVESQGVAFAMYPNPASAQLVLELPAALSASVRIQDATGREVYSLSNVPSRHVVSTAGLADGMYQVVVISGGLRAVKPLVIAH